MDNILWIVLRAVEIFTWLLYVLIFIRVIVSWLPISRDGQIMRFLYTMTEPVLGPIRSLLAKSPLGGPGMMLDFSPIIAIFLIGMLRTFISSIIGGF